MNSWAPARIARAARSGSAPTPHATTGAQMRSASLAAIRPAMSSSPSTSRRSAPWPFRSAWVARSQVSTCETWAPAVIAIFAAWAVRPDRRPTTSRRMQFSPGLEKRPRRRRRPPGRG